MKGAVTVAGTNAATSGETKKDTPVAVSTDMSQGEIRKVDVDNKKITIKHGEIKSLDMPGMTMVFGVKDEALLGKLKVGDKIRFTAERSAALCGDQSAARTELGGRDLGVRCSA
jgi:Cu/Ag efflux protein CusF